MIIENSSIDDLEDIFKFYKIATEFQQTKNSTVWPTFSRELVVSEIENLCQWKIIIDNQIACVWAITFEDPLIWEEKNDDPSIYIHRIATNPAFRGQNLVGKIIKWAVAFAKENNKKFVRLDTVGENIGLINYYQKCGFEFLGLFKLENTNGLPAHYHNATVSLFELEV
jgi:ribosomal protein S18 acetylase RimI-like enzyme